MNRSTMGVLLLALALANALLLGWGQGFFGGNPGSTQREPAAWQRSSTASASSCSAPRRRAARCNRCNAARSAPSPTRRACSPPKRP